MGGSGGGSPDFGRPTGGSEEPLGGDGGACANYHEQTVIASPRGAVVRTLSANEVLRLRLTDPERPPVRAETQNGELVGTVMPPTLSKLVTCMRAGHRYEAQVLEISGGAVTVEIRPEGS
jgi:hypothetical protein